MKTLAYISKVGTYGSAAFLVVNTEKGIYTTGQTASSPVSPRNSDIVASDMLKKALKDTETDVKSKGFTLVSETDFYNQTYK